MEAHRRACRCENILTVGAVTEERHNTVFSSLGHTADGRIKPDVMALGQDAWLFDVTGSITVANGTSFSTPIMAGAVACLMQACPSKRPEEIIRAVQLSGDNVKHPDNVLAMAFRISGRHIRCSINKGRP